MVGVYLGYDKPRHLGRGGTGGQLAAPIVKDFLKVALADKPAVPFRVPAGIKLIRVDPRTGMRAGPGEPAILEAFKPGTAPPDGYSVDRRHRFGDRRTGWVPPQSPQQSPAAAAAAAVHVPRSVRRPRALLGHSAAPLTFSTRCGRLRRQSCASLLHPAPRRLNRLCNTKSGITPMRAEIEAVVEEIKQSVGLLRRHL